MDLNTYLAYYRIKKQEFAHQLGISDRYLRMIIDGRKPSEELANQIAVLTDGEVQLNEMTIRKKPTKNQQISLCKKEKVNQNKTTQSPTKALSKSKRKSSSPALKRTYKQMNFVDNDQDL